MMDKGSQDQLENQLIRCLDWSEDQNFIGYNKFDGNDGPITPALSFKSRFIALLWSQLVCRFPINIRKFLLIPKKINPKGLALFLRTYLDLYEHSGKSIYLEKAEELSTLILEYRSKPFNHFCWGYQNRWVGPVFIAEEGYPNAVVTAFVCQSFCHLYKLTKKEKYLEVVVDAEKFFFEDLPRLVDTETELAIGYIPDNVEYEIVNVNAQYAGFLSRLYALTGNKEYLVTAKRLLNHLKVVQTDEGGWFYSNPGSSHPTKHDNYHTANVLEGFFDFIQVTDDSVYDSVFRRGVDFYFKNLFTKEGLPKWRHNKIYPLDSHSASSGLIFFSNLSQLKGYHDERYNALCLKLYHFINDNLYSGKGYFYYQKTRFFTKRFVLMRWSQAWICRSFSTYLTNLSKTDT